MKLSVILSGATGMVGEGVLHECLQHPDVERILVINRMTCGIRHPKLKEIIHNDFFNITPISTQLGGYNACFYCLGVSSVGMTEEKYHRFTYALTLHVAEEILRANKEMVFCYISGTGTDSTEKGKWMWARVKGKTENDLMKMPFKDVYAFRPGYLHPTKGLQNTLPAYRYLSWMYPMARVLLRNRVSTLKELGLAMIHATSKGYSKKVIEVKDILKLAKRQS
ncbi:MAG: epimerase [Chitinophagaceae bacterium]|nr:MAG: epimerase [Chitinophagaceae bacterium]